MEDEDFARKRIAAKAFLHQRQAIHTYFHVGVAAGDPDPHTCRDAITSLSLDNAKHPRQRGSIDIGVNNDATILSDLDCYGAARSCRFRCYCLGSSNRHSHEAGRCLSEPRLGAEGAATSSAMSAESHGASPPTISHAQAACSPKQSLASRRTSAAASPSRRTLARRLGTMPSRLNWRRVHLAFGVCPMFELGPSILPAPPLSERERLPTILDDWGLTSNSQLRKKKILRTGSIS
jgi:hypothetical protein